MSKKTVFLGALLLTIALSFGAILIASFHSGNILVAGSGIDFKTTPPIQNVNPNIQSLNEAFVEISRAVTPTVVYIEVTNAGKDNKDKKNEFEFFFGPDFNPEDMPSQGSGSGVIISADGYIMTNNHVVSKASKDGIRVVLTDKREFNATLIGTDPNTDIAVIKIEGMDLPVATIGNSENVQVGQWVIAVGNPLGLNNTVTSGIVSAMGRNLPINGDSYAINNFIQTDAAINPGNSGGALVDINGSVIGINSAIKTNTGYFQGYGFAIPINLAKNVASELIKTGKVSRGYIGVSIKDVDIKEAKGLGLNEAKGVLVQNVLAGGAGEEAGLKVGDIILKVDGIEVNAANQLQTIIGSKHPGDEVALDVFRDGTHMNKTVRLKPRAEENESVSDNSGGSKEGITNDLNSRSFETVGLSVSDLTGSLKAKYDVDKGVYVNSVVSLSEAYKRGLREGYVIISADRQDVESVEQFGSILNNKSKGDVLILKVVTPNKDIRLIAIEL